MIFNIDTSFLKLMGTTKSDRKGKKRRGKNYRIKPYSGKGQSVEMLFKGVGD